jgi:hypothetical protein
MMAAFDSPLRDEHCQCLDDCLKHCANTRILLEKMRAAGVPAEEAEKVNEKQAAIAMGIKRQFFPDRS